MSSMLLEDDVMSINESDMATSTMGSSGVANPVGTESPARPLGSETVNEMEDDIDMLVASRLDASGKPTLRMAVQPSRVKFQQLNSRGKLTQVDMHPSIIWSWVSRFYPYTKGADIDLENEETQDVRHKAEKLLESAAEELTQSSRGLESWNIRVVPSEAFDREAGRLDLTIVKSTYGLQAVHLLSKVFLEFTRHGPVLNWQAHLRKPQKETTPTTIQSREWKILENKGILREALPADLRSKIFGTTGYEMRSWNLVNHIEGVVSHYHPDNVDSVNRLRSEWTACDRQMTYDRFDALNQAYQEAMDELDLSRMPAPWKELGATLVGPAEWRHFDMTMDVLGDRDDFVSYQ